MNKAQRKIIISSVLLLAASGIFPPWMIKIQGRIIDMGYWWITNPPVRTNAYGYKFYSVINIDTLIIQWAIIILVSVGLIFYFKSEK